MWLKKVYRLNYYEPQWAGVLVKIIAMSLALIGHGVVSVPYADMLAAGESTTLPRAVQSAIDARLKLFEDRISSLLYKQTVEMDMAMSILLQSLNVSEEVLRQERAKSIAAVKRTNGQLRLEQKLRELESEAWQG